MRIILVACVFFVVYQGKTMSLPSAIQVRNAEIYDVENHPLIIKAYPAIENYQSDLYEVYAKPYTYYLNPLSAVAVFQGEGESAVKGEIVFLQKQPPNGPVLVSGNLTGLPVGKHGLHVHQAGDLRQGCDKLGGHFNPHLLQHGGPRHPLRHVGDLGNVEAKDDGSANVELVDPVLSLGSGPRGIIGRAIVVTESEDDLGQGGTANSLVDGNSGKTIACGVIAYIR